MRTTDVNAIPTQSNAPKAMMAWQSVLRDAVRSIDELADELGLSRESLAPGATATTDFPLLVPRGFVTRMRRGDPNDPLLLQVLPDSRETLDADEFSNDPLEELQYANEGLIRKYASRALLITTAACPVHCRYCFRRAFPYTEQLAARDNWAAALNSVAEDPGVSELILSGGDPLSMSDTRLERLFDQIATLKQIETVRIHTRFPIMIPERVNDSLLKLLARDKFEIVIVIHTNHANEIDDNVAAACLALKANTSALLNQSVLLKGVNDNVRSLAALSRRLMQCGVLPYYIHMLDRVTGAAHFEVPDDLAIALVESLRATLPGYLVPRLVREVPGGLSKTPIR
jgi:EF-P beta-lysylation protein EpmB